MFEDEIDRDAMRENIKKFCSDRGIPVPCGEEMERQLDRLIFICKDNAERVNRLKKDIIFANDN